MGRGRWLCQGPATNLHPGPNNINSRRRGSPRSSDGWETAEPLRPRRDKSVMAGMATLALSPPVDLRGNSGWSLLPEGFQVQKAVAKAGMRTVEGPPLGPTADPMVTFCLATTSLASGCRSVIKLLTWSDRFQGPPIRAGAHRCEPEDKRKVGAAHSRCRSGSAEVGNIPQVASQGW